MRFSFAETNETGERRLRPKNRKEEKQKWNIVARFVSNFHNFKRGDHL